MYLTQENFEQTFMSSKDKPVFCFFYDADPSCDAARNAITTAISDSNEYVTLAMCDIQDPMVNVLGGRMGLRTLPTLVVIDNGQPAAILEGDGIIDGLQETLNQFMPGEGDMLMRAALASEAEGDLNNAVAKAAEAFALDESNLSWRFIYARLLIAALNTAKAHELLDNLGREEKQSPEYQQLMSALDLAEQAQNSPEMVELKEKYEQEQSAENTVAYAVALSAAGKKEEALSILFAFLKKDLGNEDVKKTFLDILATMDGDPNQSLYRRRLYTLMY